jgi:hypothetical protein
MMVNLTSQCVLGTQKFPEKIASIPQILKIAIDPDAARKSQTGRPFLGCASGKTNDHLLPAAPHVSCEQMSEIGIPLPPRRLFISHFGAREQMHLACNASTKTCPSKINRDRRKRHT